MNESKHTRGPWNAPPSHPFLVRSSNMELVVDCRRGGNVCYTAEDVANARLIAAAPDLLEACEAALEYDAEIHRHAAINQKDPKSWVGCEELDRLYEKWTSASRAAIARASGGPFGAKEGEADAELPDRPRVKDVARWLGRHPNTIYNLIRKGEIPCKVVGKRIFVFDKAALLEWAKPEEAT